METMARRNTVLKVTHLTKSYGDNTIVDNFNLVVHEGEAIALTGRNGAGKSTVLRCIIGADRPTEGSVEVCGVRMSETNPDIRRNVATVIDDLDFFPDLSVVAHLDLMAPGDADLAESLMAKHIENAKKHMLGGFINHG